jgi:hypothetical protein
MQVRAGRGRRTGDRSLDQLRHGREICRGVNYDRFFAEAEVDGMIVNYRAPLTRMTIALGFSADEERSRRQRVQK